MSLEQPTALRVRDPGVRDLFAREARWQAWLDVEVALARAEAEVGMIPESAATEIERRARLELFDLDRVTEGLRVTGHGLVPLVWELDRLCEGDAGGFVHWGATTQNITQTRALLQVRRAHRIVLHEIAGLLEALAAARRAHQGRRHRRSYARPARGAVDVRREGGRVDRRAVSPRRAAPADSSRGCSSQCSAAAGATAASFDGHGPTLQARIGELLGFGSMPLPSRTTYDHMTEYVLALAMLDTSCGKAAREVRTLMAEEFGEVEEPVPPGSVGSSTMPQKRNPKLCQDIIADETELRSLVPLAPEAMLGDHEADGSRSVMIDRALSRALELTGDILVRLLDIVTGLRVFPERMRRNLDLSGGLIMSESLMLTLGREIGRQRAHDVVYEAAQEAATSDESFATILVRDEEVAARLGTERLAELLDPTRYTGDSGRQAEEQAARALGVAGCRAARGSRSRGLSLRRAAR